jgi:hypothetical protein
MKISQYECYEVEDMVFNPDNGELEIELTGEHGDTTFFILVIQSAYLRVNGETQDKAKNIQLKLNNMGKLLQIVKQKLVVGIYENSTINVSQPEQEWLSNNQCLYKNNLDAKYCFNFTLFLDDEDTKEKFKGVLTLFAKESNYDIE